jgi:hypothetical protein
MRSFVRIAVAGFAAALVSHSVSASEASATAELKQLRIQLVDLDPLDGISPSIQFHNSRPVSVFGQADSWAWPAGFVMGDAPAGAALTGSAIGISSLSSLQLAVSAGDVLGNAGPTLFAAGNSEAGGSFWGTANFNSVFTLSPQTRVVVSGEPGELQAYLAPDVYRYVMGAVTLGFCPLTPEGMSRCIDEHTSADISISQFAIESRGPSPAYEHSSRPSHLSLSWDNASELEQAHYLYANAFAFVGTLAPVPEPGSAWLLLAGLALAVPVSLRRRR